MIKATIDTKTLYQNIKLLKGIAGADYGNPIYRNRLGIMVDENGFRLLAGPGSVYMAIEIPAEYTGEGFCYVDFNILNIVKIAKGEKIELTLGKQLSLKDERGLKANLALLDIPNTYDLAQRITFWEGSAQVEVSTQDLGDISRASEAFPDVGGFRYVNLIEDGGKLLASTQMSELGGIEAYPLSDVEGTLERICISPKFILSFLQFTAESCMLHLPRTSACAAVTITDPNNPDWWGFIARQA